MQESQEVNTAGIYRIPAEAYHLDPVRPFSLSRGNLADILDTTPAHARIRHPRFMEATSEEEEAAEAKFDIGTAAHALFLEGINVVAVCDFKNWTSGDAKAARKTARERGKIPLLPKQYKHVTAMVEAANRQLAASELGIKNLQEQGDSELTYVWEEDGTYFRIRPDWISHKNIAGDRKLILDYKTTGISADPARFKASDNGRDIQHALYRRGVKAVEGGKRPRFLFFVQETYPPYAASLIGLDPQAIQMAEQKVDYAKCLWEQCIARNDWPAYPRRACYVESKPWELAAWEAKASSIGMEDL